MPITELKIGHLDESRGGSRQHAKALVLPLQERAGFIFAVLDLRGDRASANSLTELIGAELENAALNVDETTNFQHAFEQLLSKMNEAVGELAETRNFSLTAADCNALIGIAADDRMYISGSGEMVGVFLHQKDKTRYQIYNLFRGIETEQGQADWEKIFSVVLDGDLHPGDVFIAANQELSKEVPKDDLMTIVSTLPPSGAAVKLRQYFPLKTDFGVVIVKAQGDPKTMPVAVAAGASLDELERTSSSTQRLLEDQRPDLKTGVMSVVKTLLKILAAGAVVAVSLAIGLARGLFRLIMALVKSDRKAAVKLTRTRADATANRVLNRFNSLPKTSKYILLAALVVVFVFVVSLMFMRRAEVQQQESEAFDQAIQLIEEKRDAAAASVIYQDENQARTLLLEAMSLAEGLDTFGIAQHETKEALRTELEAALDELRHIETVDQPEVLADLRGVEATAAAANIEQAASGLFLLANNQQAYQLDQASKTLLPLETAADDTGVPQATGYDDTNNVIYFLDDRPGVSRLDPDQNILEAVSIDLGPGAIPDIEVYARRIYAISPAAEQILRYDRAGAGFSSGTAWILNKSTSLADAVSLTIDGDIYVYKSDGSFAKFSDNEEVNWRLGIIDPPLQGDGFIWTSEESPYLYLLEPSGQRVVVIEKETGTLALQYYSDNFNELKDFVVDEAARKLYLLSGTQILGIDLKHL